MHTWINFISPFLYFHDSLFQINSAILPSSSFPFLLFLLLSPKESLVPVSSITIDSKQQQTREELGFTIEGNCRCRSNKKKNREQNTLLIDYIERKPRLASFPSDRATGCIAISNGIENRYRKKRSFLPSFLYICIYSRVTDKHERKMRMGMGVRTIRWRIHRWMYISARKWHTCIGWVRKRGRISGRVGRTGRRCGMGKGKPRERVVRRIRRGVGRGGRRWGCMRRVRRPVARNRNMNIRGVGTACGIYIQKRVVTPPAEKKSTMHRGVAI